MFNKSILDLPICIKNTDKFNIEVPKKENCSFLFIASNDESIDLSKNNNVLPKNELSIIVTNKTEKHIDVNLLDKKYFPNGFEDEDLKIEIANCYLDDDKIKPTSIRCYTLNPSQLTQIINLDNEKYIISQMYFEHNQVQSCVIDMQYDETFKIGDEFKTTLLHKSKVMYSFISK
jgi:hypothetical protein